MIHRVPPARWRPKRHYPRRRGPIGPSVSSRSAARATRSTPRNSRRASRHRAGRLVGADAGDDESISDAADHGGYREASVVLVNTCGFIEAAKQDSIGELLSAADSGRAVVAAGCLAERYGAELAEALPEAEVISFDDYPDIGARLDAVLAGERRQAHTPRDRRQAASAGAGAAAGGSGTEPTACTCLATVTPPRPCHYQDPERLPPTIPGPQVSRARGASRCRPSSLRRRAGHLPELCQHA